ncbi:zf-HC2 domain-containing protein [Massilia sp. DWR3-1-1]|uniref:zf-HC2 domain-containing protein n=1 Tax=Massilia sp. DWR3-1-1 TaxID=2804559 RepID=UPI003CF8B150
MTPHGGDPAFLQAHAQAQQALPWLANGSLADPERALVQAHLEICGSCRAELALLHTLRGAGPGPAPHCDVERALARLLPQLDAAAPLAPPQAATLRWRERLAANDRYWLRAGVALQGCVIAALAILLAQSPAGADRQAGAYRALAASAAVRSAMVVSFQPDTPERELRRILQASGARVVGGPTATGAWLLEADGGPATLARLRAEPAVVLAESLGTAGAP